MGPWQACGPLAATPRISLLLTERDRDLTMYRTKAVA
jgi:hypothetical protein